jgi:CheY-like chemotaxis protein
MNSILREQVELLEHTTFAQVRFELNLAPDLHPICGDSSALSHTIMNLCVNAVDAMSQNGTLTLRTRNVDENWIEVFVEDSGTGMSKEVLAKALDPFFTTKEHGKGTGLGLSMAYSTVRAHQGQLHIQSDLGKGTCVRMLFPTRKPESTNSPAVSESKTESCRSLDVLVVDDDDLIRDALQAMLEELGHRAVIASCGEEALKRLETGLVADLVIMDINMPGLGGVKTLPLLRALRPTIPVLLATGRPDQDATFLSKDQTHVALLLKPFGMLDLKRQLEELVRSLTSSGDRR